MSLRADRVATSVLFFANGFAFGGWSAAIAPMREALALSEAELGLLLFTLAAGAVSFVPVAGLAGPWLGGTGRIASGAGFVFAAAFAVAAIAPGAWTLAPVGLVIGASNGLMDVNMNAHATEVERRWGSPINSSFHAAFSVGGLAGAGVGAGVLALGFGWRGLLLTSAALALAMIGAAARGLSAGEKPKRTGNPFGWPPAAVLALAAIAFLCFLVEGAMIDWTGVFLVSLGVRAAAAPLGYAAFASTMIAGRLAGDRVVTRLGRLPTVVAGAALAAAGLSLAAFLPGLTTAAVGFALVGAGLSNVVPALFSESAAQGSTAARGIAAVATAGYTGLLIGPPLVGAVASLTDLRVAFAGLAWLALGAALLGVRARRAPLT